MMKVILSLLALSCFAGIAFAEGNPAYFVLRKGFKQNLVNVDGQLLSLKEFSKLCENKSPAAVEQIKLAKEKRGESMGEGFFSCLFAIVGYNRYLSSRDITDSQGIATRQAEGIGFLALAIFSAINGHTAAISAQDAQNRAIDYFNRDTGRIKLSLGMRNNPAGFTLTKRF